MRARDHAPQRDAGGFDQQGAFGALLPPIYRGSACGFAAAGCLDDAPINDDLAQVEADALVVGLQTQLLELGEDPSRDPLVASVADGGRRTRRVRDPLIGGASTRNPE